MDTNVMNFIQVGFDCLSHMDTNVMNLIQVGFDCLSLFDTKGKDGYECYEFDTGWVCLFISSGYKC